MRSPKPVWITGRKPNSAENYRALYLTRSIAASGRPRRATARVSALGWYRLFVNGHDVTGPALVPRWTPFDHYVEYQEYDVTGLLQDGGNRLDVAIGDGRFRGCNGALSHNAIYGDRLAAWVCLTVESTDGTVQTIVSDGTWSVTHGPIVTSDPKYGETVDLRIAQPWDEAAEAHGTTPVEVLDMHRHLIPEEVARVGEVARLAPVSIVRTPSGQQLIDFGQNASGIVRLRLSGPAGNVVTLTHSEIVRPDGEIDTDYLKLGSIGADWTQTDRVTLDGGETWWQPWFTIHGFRYVAVDGLADDLAPADIEYLVLSSAIEQTGAFDCSDPRLSKLYRNVHWSFLSNFTDTPTDCPTRERSGWTGDAQVFAETAAVLADVRAFFRRYLRNLAAEQLPDGRVPMMIPSESSPASGGLGKMFTAMAGSAGWGDAAVLIPWTLYRYYGDRDLVEEAYPAAAKWVDFLLSRASKTAWRKPGRRGKVMPDLEPLIVDRGFDWGEWMRPGESFVGSVLDALARSGSSLATAYLEHSCRLVANMAAILGRSEDQQRYRALADRTRIAWRQAYLGPDGRIGMDRQDDYVRALAFDLLDEGEKPAATARLVALIEQAGDHLGTGFMSTGLLLHVLADQGREDVAYRLLFQNEAPSWLYQIDKGATTTWETWEGYEQNGRAKASHNHYSFGAVANFLVERVAGIGPADAGYTTVALRPGLRSGLNSASATVGTPFGAASINWRIDGDTVTVKAVVPDGARARLDLGGEPRDLPAGEHEVTASLPAKDGNGGLGETHASSTRPAAVRDVAGSGLLPATRLRTPLLAFGAFGLAALIHWKARR